MSWNNIIPAVLLSSAVEPKPEIKNPAISIPDELVTDCRLAYTWEGEPSLLAGSEDHPAFAQIRRMLERRGYIDVPPYACWNGDRVLRRFRFNGFQLEPGDKFYCASAWATKISVRRDQ